MQTVPRETHYAAARGGVHIGYQVIGSGPVDLVFVPAFASNVDIWWEMPAAARFLERLASACRLVLVDKRGWGISDRLTRVDPMEERADDVRAVMDSVGSREAVVFAASEACPIACFFAAVHPERTRGLFLWGSLAAWTPKDDYPFARWPEMWAQVVEMATDQWGTGFTANLILPSLANEPGVREWCQRYERACSSPGAFALMTLNNTLIDVRSILPLVRTPARVLHAETDAFVPVDGGRYVASKLPNASYAELPGSDHAFFGQAGEQLAGEITRFVSELPPSEPPQESVATMLVAEPHVRAAGAGADLGQIFAAEVGRRGGRVLRLTDGLAAASFPWPARALHAAVDIRAAARERDVDLRAAVHTGSFPLDAARLATDAVDAVARLKDAAHRGEILLTRLTRDLIAGSGIEVGEHARAFSIPGLGDVEAVPVVDGLSPQPEGGRRKLRAAVDRALEMDRVPARLSPLTKRQSEIAYLISCGLTNRAIGARLCLSPRTVENHLFNILTTLDFDSRTQLAAWVARQT